MKFNFALIPILLSVFVFNSCKEGATLPERNHTENETLYYEEGQSGSAHGSPNASSGWFSKVFSAGKDSIWSKMGNGFSGLMKSAWNLGSRSLGYCAKSVRNLLNKLVGTNVQSGPSACKYDVNHLNKHFKKPGLKWVQVDATPSSIKPGDVTVCSRSEGCSPNQGLHGHIEMALPSQNGGIDFVSDFRQRASLCFTNQSRYSQPPRVYRAVPEDGVGFYKNINLEILFTSAWAANHEKDNDGVSEDPNINKDYQALWLGPLQGHKLKVYEPPLDGAEGAYYELFKIESKTEKSLGKSYENPYEAIRLVKDKKLQREFAKAYIFHWINIVGKDKVQEIVLRSKTLDPLQKEAYLDSGLRLPQKYEIYPNP